MDIRFECPHCKQRIKVDESGAGLEFNCPGCHALLTIPALAKVPQPIKPGPRTLPRLRAESPAAASESDPAAASPVAALGKPGKGGQYRCNNPTCGAVLSESQVLTQQVSGRMSKACPKCRQAVTLMAKPPGFFARMMGKKKS
jgi:hypothetical protein